MEGSIPQAKENCEARVELIGVNYLHVQHVFISNY